MVIVNSENSDEDPGATQRYLVVCETPDAIAPRDKRLRSLSQSRTNKGSLFPTPSDVFQHTHQMHATLIRRSLGGLVPPKIATPKLVVSSALYLNLLDSPLIFLRYITVWWIGRGSISSRRVLFKIAQGRRYYPCRRYQRSFLLRKERVRKASGRCHCWHLGH